MRIKSLLVVVCFVMLSIASVRADGNMEPPGVTCDPVVVVITSVVVASSLTP